MNLLDLAFSGYTVIHDEDDPILVTPDGVRVDTGVKATPTPNGSPASSTTWKSGAAKSNS